MITLIVWYLVFGAIFCTMLHIYLFCHEEMESHREIYKVIPLKSKVKWVFVLILTSPAEILILLFMEIVMWWRSK